MGTLKLHGVSQTLKTMATPLSPTGNHSVLGTLHGFAVVLKNKGMNQVDHIAKILLKLAFLSHFALQTEKGRNHEMAASK